MDEPARLAAAHRTAGPTSSSGWSCTVILRNPDGVERHARLAREVGASWEEILGSIMLTCPGFGLLPAVEAIPHARARLRTRARTRADELRRQ